MTGLTSQEETLVLERFVHPKNRPVEGAGMGMLKGMPVTREQKPRHNGSGRPWPP